jgi:two-component system osmolarity sensor histidine kinase EnvZ
VRIAIAPRSLLWRTFALIALLIGLSLAAWVQIFTRFEERPRARQTAQMLVSVVNLTRAAVVNADPLLRQALLRDLTVQEGLRIYPAEPGDRLKPLPDTQLMRDLEVEVKRHLGPDTLLASAREGVEGIWVSFLLDPDDSTNMFWVMLPRAKIEHGRTAEWLGWASAALLLALIGAFMTVRHIARPLAQLAQAARAVGRGSVHEPLPETGPAELAEVGRAFNQMSRDLAQLESDRALVLAGVSHDLRTPLARLRLGVEMSGAPTEEVDAMSTDIEEMGAIISQFLDFARGDSEEKAGPMDLAALADDLVSDYIRRGLPVTLLSRPAKLAFAGRQKALRRAVSNLIDNALRYAGREQNIDVAVNRENGFARLSVLDRGPGIPPPEVERLKRPFTRLEVARTDASGSGLGLAIVDRIARAHGGRLELLPREGGGLAASLVLPLSSL